MPREQDCFSPRSSRARSSAAASGSSEPRGCRAVAETKACWCRARFTCVARAVGATSSRRARARRRTDPTRFCRFRNTTPVHCRASSCETKAQLSGSFCRGLAAVETHAFRCRPRFLGVDRTVGTSSPSTACLASALPGAYCRLHVLASTDTVWRNRAGFRCGFVAASAANVPLRRSRGCGGTQGCCATVRHHG